jgi:hypothetical protein
VASDENHEDPMLEENDAVVVESAAVAGDDVNTSGESQELEPVAELNESQVPSMI